MIMLIPEIHYLYGTKLLTYKTMAEEIINEKRKIKFLLNDSFTDKHVIESFDSSDTIIEAIGRLKYDNRLEESTYILKDSLEEALVRGNFDINMANISITNLTGAYVSRKLQRDGYYREVNRIDVEYREIPSNDKNYKVFRIYHLEQSSKGGNFNKLIPKNVFMTSKDREELNAIDEDYFKRK